ncbi:ABC transporter permease [Metallosphaera tengchongensis]|uniref:ABC transporter permease n=1 Tax=Metallosphaera tengchongensis TaxID=1532350 RepID=A0A6N0NR42_9CREN|nr:FtsX-like permease family protein [Metallosphaera tengchongensis]QKQ99205.1 ABC transporter permease [Metallosphaera tengchongensis]
MRISDSIRLSFNALTSKRLRTSLTILGILIGPAIVVGLTGLTLGFSAVLTHQLFSSLSPTDIFVNPGTNVITSYTVQQISHLPGVKSVVPYYLISGTIQTPSGPEPTEILSIDTQEASLAFPGLTLQTGTYPPLTSTYGTVVGYYIAHPQYPGQPTYSSGQTITVVMNTPDGKMSKTFLVMGNFNEFSSAFADIDRALIVQDIIGQQYYGDKYSGLIVQADSVSDVNKVVTEIQNEFGRSVSVTSVEQFINLINNSLSAVSSLLFIAGASSFIVAFVGILSTMFTTVVERTREIGVLRAIGYTRRGIMVIFIGEAVLMGLLGGIAGVGAGVGMGYLLTSLSAGGSGGNAAGPRGAGIISSTHITPVFEPTFMLEVVLITVIFSLLAGIIPAYRASRIEPAVALRYEV